MGVRGWDIANDETEIEGTRLKIRSHDPRGARRNLT